MGYLDVQSLFEQLLDQVDVELKKGTVRVRALTRKEMEMVMTRKNGKEPNGLDVEVRMVQMGMVEPELDIDQVRHWASVETPGEFQKVTKAIMALSKMPDDEEMEEATKLAQKQAYADFRGE